MQLASQLFTEEDRHRVSTTVRHIETLSFVEIVPVVATASGRYDRAEDIVGLWLGVALMVVIALIWPPTLASSEPGAWGETPWSMTVFQLATITVGGFVFGAVIAARVGWLRRLFVTTHEMQEEVQRAARAAFFDSRVHHKTQGLGLMFYLSLYERIAVVLADQQIISVLGETSLEDICRMLTDRMRRSGPTDALCQTIEEIGEKLKTTMPRTSCDVNELPDALVVLD